MPDYAKMYRHLFNAQTDAVALLQKAQLETEEMYLEYKVSSSRLKNWVRRQYYRETGKGFSAEVWEAVKGTLIGKALFDGELCTVYIRCAYVDGVLYYDLNNESKQVVAISEDGWHVQDDSDVIFYRNNTMLAQVTPEHSEHDIAVIAPFYRFKNDEDRILHIVSLISKFLPHIPHPIDIVHRQKGTAKTTTMKKDKSLVDPDKVLVATLPKALDALAIYLHNHYFVAYDNITSFSGDVSNIFCQASTGGAFIARKHYSNDEEVVLEFKRVVSLNGINVVATMPDLLERGILLELEPISTTERKSEAQLWREFDEAKPYILGVIFTVLAKALAIYPTVELEKRGRMADSTEWGYAIAEAAGLGGENFLRAYLNNQNRANTEAVDANPVAAAVVELMKKNDEWVGTAMALLRELNQIAEQVNIDTKSLYWPKQPNHLSRRLKEVTANLNALGYTIESKPTGDRQIRITRAG